MAKFRGSARQGSFRPLKVADESQKIQAETQRTLNYMEDAQRVTQGNQRAIGDQLQKQNRADLQGLEQAYNIDLKNIENERGAFMQRYELETARLEAENQRTADTMRMIGELSNTALKSAQAYTEQREVNRQEAYAEAVQKTGMSAAE